MNLLASALRSRAWELLLVVLIVIAGAWASTISPYYLDPDQLLNSTQYFIIFGIMAFGLMPIVVQGEIDISLASTLAVGTVTLARLSVSGVPVALAMLLTVLICAALGAINGVLVAYAGLPSLAVTLGTMGAYRGLAYIIGGDGGITGIPGDFTWLGTAFMGPLPLSLLVFVILAVAIAVLLGATPFGRYSYAIGNNAAASRMAGVPVAAMRVRAYILAAALTSLGSLLWIGQYASARGDNADGSILFVLTAVVLGGVSIKGGSGNVLGVVLSIVLLGTLSNGMGLANYPGTTQTLVLGCLLVGSIGIPRTIRLLRAKLAGSRTRSPGPKNQGPSANQSTRTRTTPAPATAAVGSTDLKG